MSELTPVLAALAVVDVDELPAAEQLEFLATLASGPRGAGRRLPARRPRGTAAPAGHRGLAGPPGGRGAAGVAGGELGWAGPLTPETARRLACDALPEWCDVHHEVHSVHGGPTSRDNGALLCERHHIAVHDGGFQVRRDPGTSRRRTHRPDGSQITVRPPQPHHRG
jgi:hypothetical protein